LECYALKFLDVKWRVKYAWYVTIAVGLLSEQLECQAVSSGGAAAGAAGAKPRPVFDISAAAEVAAPLLQLSKQAVVFSYIAEDHPPSLMTETLDVR
jgi:hypothetical protein